MPQSENDILSMFSQSDYDALLPRMRLVEMKHGHVVADTHRTIEQVYFPHGGVLSCVVDLGDGSSIESGMIGKDGVYGAAQALNGKLSMHRVIVQIPSYATVVDADHLRTLTKTSPLLLSLIVKYEHFFLAQVQQTTACNAMHQVEQRMCKWLVRMHDLAGDKLPLTQDFLAQMMGVRRPSVNGVATRLQKQGLISYSRGRLVILDIGKVERQACECHSAVRNQYQRLFDHRE